MTKEVFEKAYWEVRTRAEEDFKEWTDFILLKEAELANGKKNPKNKRVMEIRLAYIKDYLDSQTKSCLAPLRKAEPDIQRIARTLEKFENLRESAKALLKEGLYRKLEFRVGESPDTPVDQIIEGYLTQLERQVSETVGRLQKAKLEISEFRVNSRKWEKAKSHLDTLSTEVEELLEALEYAKRKAHNFELRRKIELSISSTSYSKLYRENYMAMEAILRFISKGTLGWEWVEDVWNSIG